MYCLRRGNGMPSAWGHTRLLETDWRLITQESHCFSCGSVNMVSSYPSQLRCFTSDSMLRSQIPKIPDKPEKSEISRLISIFQGNFQTYFFIHISRDSGSMKGLLLNRFISFKPDRCMSVKYGKIWGFSQMKT